MRTKKSAKERAHTEGRRLLIAWLEEAGNSQSRLAELLGIQQSSVFLWKEGRARPEAHHRTAIANVAGIPQDAWLTTEERDLVGRTSANDASKDGKADIAKPAGRTGTGG